MSRESDLDRDIAALIRKMVDGTITKEERERYYWLSSERVEMMQYKPKRRTW